MPRFPVATKIAKKRFLEHFRQCGVISYAAVLAGTSGRQVIRWRQQDEAFGEAFREAQIQAEEVLEAEVYRRAVEGVEKPIYQGGKLVGNVREYSDVLLIFLLKARNPEKYRERWDVQHSGKITSDQHVIVYLPEQRPWTMSEPSPSLQLLPGPKDD